ncbi:polysaccharide deacetylase family protein [Stappia sp. ES.058]|uniref:polysaccharide deacetylase family protein n=1 Tax=Stappia sp. ES.058 TaxID=1881061 RepID=UPI00087C2475|nr:polysaccharide deacetylase family protein [Stappia sp. ES.058]SDU48815.1 Polysaccharide deacetylase [Stappia sp. ES.058]
MAPLTTVTPGLSLAERAKRRVKTAGLRLLRASRLPVAIGRIYGGRGVILMFHDFTPDPRADLDQGCRSADFARILNDLGKSGRDIVTMDEALIRLSDPGARPFAVLTFDDGYRSNIDIALPMLERHRAPATIFVPTEMLTRTINAWWLGLKHLFLDNDTVEIEPMGVRFSCSDLASKTAGLRRATAWVWEDFHRAGMLEATFAKHHVSLPDIVDVRAIGESEMVEIDRHPLIEIGAHTTTHRALTLLDANSVHHDIVDNKTYLEDRLGREVRHFAYPYGPPSINGHREAEIVRAAGFRSGVTTTAGCLFPAHLDDRFLLPRQNGEYTEDSAAYTACGVNGLFRAVATRGGNPVVVESGRPHLASTGARG